MYKCPKCGKIFKKNGHWIKRHMIEKCYTPLLPIQYVPSKDLSQRIKKIEEMLKHGFTKYHDNPIERIKEEEEEKIHDPILIEYRAAFIKCVSELKEVLKLRKEKIDNNISP